jgi:signal transduction histidine kinase
LKQNVPDLLSVKTDLFEMKSINSFQEYLLSDFLDYKRLESKQFKLLKKNSNIQEIFQEVKDIFKEKLVENNNNLELIKKSQNLALFTDPNRMKQLLINFISNGNKFTNDGNLFVIIEDFQDHLSIIV